MNIPNIAFDVAVCQTIELKRLLLHTIADQTKLSQKYNDDLRISKGPLAIEEVCKENDSSQM